GMDGEDLVRAFESHTTSKIKTSQDLHNISTLGFRGEALASIASVAQIKAVSRIKDSNTANCVEIDCGSKGSGSPCSADFGTTIQVRDLFYKLPARRKFLRTANTEMEHITEQFTRIALANSNLDLTLIHNGREIYRLSGRDSLRQRIVELFSKEISENLIETESDEKGIHIFALLGRPDISKTSNKFQYVFLNGRFIRDKFISHAIKEAYRGNMEPDRFPVAFLYIQMPYEDYDVNVHPTKIEVRFYNANLIHSQILGCLREKLLGTEIQTHAKIPITEHTGHAFGTGHRSQKITDAMAEFFKKHRPVQTQQLITAERQAAAGQTGLATTDFSSGQRAIDIQAADTTAYPNIDQAGLSQVKFLQIHDSYIIEQIDNGFLIIDQHALHERILYERLHSRIQNSKLESQRLLIPESLEITDAQVDILKTNAELIEKLGIELVPFGPRVYAIQAFPTMLARADTIDFVRDLIDLLTEKGVGLDPERLLDEVLNMAACKAAIKAGQRLSNSEIEQLLADRQQVDYAGRCPHGRPTTIKFSLSDLEKQFKRT
ncbi:MAG: hypothetical protein A2167_08415, partial [Planctomycetes bacterium RBG_13_46_10]